MLRNMVLAFAVTLGILSAVVLGVGIAVEGTSGCKDRIQKVTGCLRP
jgi:hypothetical protein